MGDNAEHREGPPAGSSGGTGADNDALAQTGVKPSRAELNGREPQ